MLKNSLRCEKNQDIKLQSVYGILYITSLEDRAIIKKVIITKVDCLPYARLAKYFSCITCFISYLYPIVHVFKTMSNVKITLSKE